MQLTSIKYQLQQKKILVTYSCLHDKIITIDGELSLIMINLVHFSKKYLKLDKDVSTYFEIGLEQKQYVDFEKFTLVLIKCKGNPQICNKLNIESIEIILQNLKFVEEDMNTRIIYISQLPSEIVDTNPLSAENMILINKIKQNEEYVDKQIQFQDPKFQLLYIVQSTLRQQKDNQQVVIIKLGKTIKSIEEYLKSLKNNYYNKIEFTPIFARRMYCPHKTLIDTKPFHNKLIKQIPQTKVFLKAPVNPKGNNYFVEFYQLTQEFVDTFEQLLKQFIDENKKLYDQMNKNEKQNILYLDSLSSSQSIIDVDVNVNDNEKIDFGKDDSVIIQNTQNQSDYESLIIFSNSDNLQPEIKQENIVPEQEESQFLQDSIALNQQSNYFVKKISNKGVQLVQTIISKFNIKSGFFNKLLIYNQSKREQIAEKN